MDISKNYIQSLIGNGASILEIGSYNGKDGAELAAACKTMVHCFEPNLASVELIKALENNDLMIWPYAVGSSNGVALINVSNHPASDTLKVPKKHKKIFPNVKYKKVAKINITTLDKWNHTVRNNDPVDFIWCDVNGSEADVILGGAKTLSVTKYLYIEFCEVELFENAMNREQTKRALPGFEVIGEYNFEGNYGNLLFKNKNLALWQ